MDEKEFGDKIIKLVEEFVETHKDYDIFVFVRDSKSGASDNYGYGCAACTASYIFELLLNGQLKHAGQEMLENMSKRMAEKAKLN